MNKNKSKNTRTDRKYAAKLIEDDEKGRQVPIVLECLTESRKTINRHEFDQIDLKGVKRRWKRNLHSNATKII